VQQILYENLKKKTENEKICAAHSAWWIAPASAKLLRKGREEFG